MSNNNNFNKYRINKFVWSFDNVTFETCGLDKEKNFLQAPLCECGDICAYGNEIENVCENLTESNDCDQCGVFAITNNNNCVFAVKMIDEDSGNIVINLFRKNGLDDYKDIGNIAYELELHCYGLLVSKRPGLYRIVME